MQDFRDTMEVNFFSGVHLCKLFWPLIAASKNGRIVNMTSAAGKLATPGAGSYSASKFAFEGFSDALRKELKCWNVQVSIVEPGFHKTNIVTNMLPEMDKMWSSLPLEKKEAYGEEFFKNFRLLGSAANQFAGDPQNVVDAVKHAIGSATPRTRYPVGWDVFFLSPLFVLPDFFQDLVSSATYPGVFPSGVKKWIQ